MSEYMAGATSWAMAIAAWAFCLLLAWLAGVLVVSFFKSSSVPAGPVEGEPLTSSWRRSKYVVGGCFILGLALTVCYYYKDSLISPAKAVVTNVENKVEAAKATAASITDADDGTTILAKLEAKAVLIETLTVAQLQKLKAAVDNNAQLRKRFSILASRASWNANTPVSAPITIAGVPLPGKDEGDVFKD